ncbi:MAG: tRNA epoxyqueuosine(34) reductase QueG [Gemmatimonadales bacterium]|nr:MAG: tRNA epoxyqueuosine(34) reductase QueG [Gemmatimonadales bacterium]
MKGPATPDFRSGEEDPTPHPAPHPAPQEVAARLKALARGEGFDPVGITLPSPSRHSGFLRGWVEEGRHGTMDYLARPDALERRGDPRRSLPVARSALVVAHEYFQEDPEGVPGDPSRGVIARYARGRDYHRVVKKGLDRVHRGLEEELGRSVAGRSYVDTGPLLERELGERAGLGWFGRNTMLIHPRRGSYFFLGVLLLELEAEVDEPLGRDHCGSCRACLDACPTGALLGRDADGAPVMDATLCISYLTIENRGPIPRELRPLMGNRVYGCDICQEVCPFNVKFAEEAVESGYAARGPGERPVGVEASGPAGPGSESAAPLHPGTDAPSLVDLLSMALSEEGWESFSRGSAIRRAGRAGFARNVCVALGNWLSGKEEPPSEAVRVLAAALSDPESLVRGHAAWALGRISSAAARSALERRASVEEDPWVRSEIISALEESTPTRK